jgi:hypothetical protein
MLRSLTSVRTIPANAAIIQASIGMMRFPSSAAFAAFCSISCIAIGIRSRM